MQRIFYGYVKVLKFSKNSSLKLLFSLTGGQGSTVLETWDRTGSRILFHCHSGRGAA